MSAGQRDHLVITTSAAGFSCDTSDESRSSSKSCVSHSESGGLGEICRFGRAIEDPGRRRSAVLCSACRCTLQVFLVPGGGGLVVLASRDDDGADYTSGAEEVIGRGVEAEDLQPTSGPSSWRTPPRERLWPLHTRSTSPIFFDGRLPLPCNTRIDDFQCLHANNVCCVSLSGCLQCAAGTNETVLGRVEQVLACSRPFALPSARLAEP